jgi:hypothetical protein
MAYENNINNGGEINGVMAAAICQWQRRQWHRSKSGISANMASIISMAPLNEIMKSWR